MKRETLLRGLLTRCHALAPCIVSTALSIFSSCFQSLSSPKRDFTLAAAAFFSVGLSLFRRPGKAMFYGIALDVLQGSNASSLSPR